jgi:hypothetical protein
MARFLEADLTRLIPPWKPDSCRLGPLKECANQGCGERGNPISPARDPRSYLSSL